MIISVADLSHNLITEIESNNIYYDNEHTSSLVNCLLTVLFRFGQWKAIDEVSSLVSPVGSDSSSSF